MHISYVPQLLGRDPDSHTNRPFLQDRCIVFSFLFDFFFVAVPRWRIATLLLCVNTVRSPGAKNRPRGLHSLSDSLGAFQLGDDGLEFVDWLCNRVEPNQFRKGRRPPRRSICAHNPPEEKQSFESMNEAQKET